MKTWVNVQDDLTVRVANSFHLRQPMYECLPALAHGCFPSERGPRGNRLGVGGAGTEETRQLIS